MKEIKCTICGCKRPSMFEIKQWVCDQCQEKEKQAEMNYGVEE